MTCPLPNESKKDQITRFVIAIVLILAAQFWLMEIWKEISYILAIVAAVTSMTGYCGLYAILGIKTK